MDYERAFMLMSICEKSRLWTPSLNALHDAAMAELVEMNQEAKQHLDEQAAAAAEEKAKAEKEEKARIAKENADKPAPRAVPARTDDDKVERR